MGGFWAVFWSMVDHIVPNNESDLDYVLNVSRLFRFYSRYFHHVSKPLIISFSVHCSCVLLWVCAQPQVIIYGSGALLTTAVGSRCACDERDEALV